MYRLLKLRGAPINNNYSKSLCANVQTTTRVCSFCRFAHPKVTKSMISHLQYRHASTTINTLLLDKPLRKKNKRRQKRYVELLEVSDNVTNNCKASIRKLNAAQLSILVDQPDISLDKLHKIRSDLNQANNHKIQTYEDPSVAHDLILLETERTERLPKLKKTHLTQDGDDESLIIEDLQASGIADQAGLIKNSAFLDSLQEDAHRDDAEEEAHDNPSKGGKKKGRVKISKTDLQLEKEAAAKAINAELLEKGKQEYYVQLLHAYLLVCLNCGMTPRAYNTLMRARTNGLKNPTAVKIQHVGLFNLLLHTYAASANMPKIKDILRVLKEDSIKPSPDTYAAVFESLGRLRNPDREREFFEAIRLEMEENGITFDDVVKTPKYIHDQREHTMKGIEILQPDFQPTYDVPDFSYDCHLLKGINHTESRVRSIPAENLLDMSDLRERLSEQLKNEVCGDVVVKSIEKTDDLKPSVRFSRKIISNLEKSWKEIALKAFNRNLTTLKNREGAHFTQTLTLFPYLCALDQEEYIKAIISDVRRLADGSETFSPALSSLYRSLGSRINSKYEVHEKQRYGVMEKTKEVYLKYCEWYLEPDGAANSRIAWNTIAHEAEKNGVSLDVVNLQWPAQVCFGIGKFLYDIILKDIKLDINCIKPNSKEKHYLPAFYTLFRYKGKRIKEEIKPHPLLAKLYRESQPETLTFPVSMVPSVCPPKPWSNIYSGGYLVAKSDVVRVPIHSCQQWRRFESATPKKLWPALDSLNQLAAVPWSVNTSVLDVIIEIFQEGGSAKLNVPQSPSVLPAVPLLKPDADRAERLKVAKARMELRRRKSELYSLWCDSLYRLSLANHFRDTIFWLPHNMDFRGRVYPIPPHLNHLGSDLARSLLVFALGKPLGPTGLDWLKIHTVNLTGLKKRDPVSERLKYANENIDKILDSAENPLKGEMWWSTSDEPWQTLAACMEIAKALKAEDPEKYVSRFPIHQDGSCNGLQHYAALGRDQIGAENVNLHPFDTPQDVYSSVAAMVDSIRERDAAKGLKIANVLEGFIKRKVIKQTVMTTVYGVTKFGARLQIARQLKDIDNFPQEHVWAASIYLVQKTFESLRTMFESAREIQDWFTECARVISISRGRNVEWVSPLGLPIVQPYNKQDKLYSMKEDMDYIERPNTMKQKNAFPPNFVHSLDSSHMMLTSLHCENAGLTFMSVHDCYWTHPCTVETMNKICREQFVALHSEPILEELSQFLLEKYGFNECDFENDGTIEDISNRKINYTLSSVPTKGAFNLEGVLKSIYFFS